MAWKRQDAAVEGGDSDIVLLRGWSRKQTW